MAEAIRFGEILFSLRSKDGISQEALAEKLGVSKQAIQKWESGKCLPDISNLAAISEYWNVSFDYLLKGVDNRSVEQLRTDVHPLPSYEKMHEWESYSKSLYTDYRQCCEEGKDIKPWEDVLFAIARLPDGKQKAALADTIYPTIEALPQRSDYRYFEPDDYASVLAASKPISFDYPKIPKDKMLDKLLGAWYGRICGCLLGKPIECIKRKELHAVLKKTGNFPLTRYITASDAAKTDDLGLAFPLKERVYADGPLDGMPGDDDTNYIVLAMLLIKKYGRDFTAADVAQHWMESQSKNAYCTAERVAFRNFVNGYYPPESALYKNPYREWIGAQIRGDFFGWINPGDPKTASEYAYRDASISHVKNGIYGEMWVSALLAAVGGGADIESAIRIGASYIPEGSRLHEALTGVLASYEKGMTAEEFFLDFHKRWNDEDGFDWCHTVSNAEIVAASLLWGGGDYGKTICLAVEQGFDTDCNGATAGSVVGLANGFSSIPPVWTSKISGTLYTSIFGYQKVSVEDMAKETMEMLPKKA